MDLNSVEWNGFDDNRLPDVKFVAFEMTGIKVIDDEIIGIDADLADEWAVYGRLSDGRALHLHDTCWRDEAKVRLMLLLSSLDTPAAKWQEDPHGDSYECKRSDLPLGHLSDDALANAVFLHNHRELDLEAILSGQPSSIGLLTAAKERIRWLSRKVTFLEARDNPSIIS